MLCFYCSLGYMFLCNKYKFLKAVAAPRLHLHCKNRVIKVIPNFSVMDYPGQHFPKSLYSMSQAGQRSCYSSAGASILRCSLPL